MKCHIYKLIKLDDDITFTTVEGTTHVTEARRYPTEVTEEIKAGLQRV